MGAYVILPGGHKGQLNSEWIYEVIVSPKMPTKNLKDFCTGSLIEQGVHWNLFTWADSK